MHEDIFQIVSDRVDWDREELADFKHRLGQGENTRTVILDFVGHLRRRRTPDLGYSADYVREVREHADARAVVAARARWEKALQEVLFVHHVVSFTQLGAETLIASATPDLCQRTAAKVIDFQAEWSAQRARLARSSVSVNC